MRLASASACSDLLPHREICTCMRDSNPALGMSFLVFVELDRPVHLQLVSLCKSMQARNSSLESGSAKTLNQLLVEMDGFEANEGVVVIAATNLDQKLDAALKRPGRFDREVAVPLPDVRGRLDIIQYYLKVSICRKHAIWAFCLEIITRCQILGAAIQLITIHDRMAHT